MKLFNTMSRSVDELKPLTPGKIKIYTCGLTVYSQPHIGNWVGYIYWDVLIRTLEATGYDVLRTQNYTDVGHLVSDDDSGEDKMEKGAKAEGITAWDVAEKYIKIAEHEAYDLLGLKKPSQLERATDYIAKQIAFVGLLEKKGYTYAIPDEGIYFDTSKLKDYGKLARLDSAGLEAGARVPVAGKKNLTDFALWKLSPTDHNRDMEWASPWGKGFPGWHLECSVIAQETLGDQIDIHTGGIDHIPVHHTNEIAQTESLTGKSFSAMWVHNNHLKVEGSKMSKSIGNIYTLEDITKHGFSIEAFKLMVLSKHYRTEGNFTWEILEASQNRLKKFQAMATLRYQPQADGTQESVIFEATEASMLQKLQNDLATPEALMHLDKLESTLLNGIHPDAIKAFSTFLEDVDELLGLTLSKIPDISAEQKHIVELRQTARRNKEWETADHLRSELLGHGIEVNDTQAGQIWSWR